MTLSGNASPLTMFHVLLKHRELLWGLVKRDFIGRYKGSMLGIAWALFNPLLMLAIYTIVFSVAFKARWGSAEENHATFAIILFSGMIIQNLFAECLNRAPSLILVHANYVKKVIFPIEILPWVVLFSALMHFVVSFFVLVLFCLLIKMPIYWGVLYLPIILLPLVLILMGCSWAFSALGVYLRDLPQIVTVLTTISLFLAPIFYPMEALPKLFQAFITWNPVTLPVIEIRDVMLWGKPIDWFDWSVSFAISLGVCFIGFWLFQKTRRGFADVL